MIRKPIKPREYCDDKSEDQTDAVMVVMIVVVMAFVSVRAGAWFPGVALGCDGGVEARQTEDKSACVKEK